MNGYKHILVPTDFSDASGRALEMALALARALDARLTLLHVWTIPAIVYAEAMAWPIDEMERAARKGLREAFESTVKLHANTDSVLREGRDWRVILDVAKERACDLILMGTHGRHGLPRFVLGSVAEKVVRLSEVPVITVSGTKPAPGVAATAP